MPSFLTKVFGRNKDEKESPKQAKRASVQSSLLEGKFEAVSPTVSPSATNFAERAQEKEKPKQKEKEGNFPAIFRAKSRPTSPTLESSNRGEEFPHLSLNLPDFKDERSSRALDAVFEASPDGRSVLSDSVIGERRLTPLEALILVRTCSQAIVDRGLESLGIMHPHWYSANPETQRRLISLFILSLNSKSLITSLSPNTTDNAAKFESEIGYTRSPHDIAAVLRWGLRHLKIEGDTFGKESSWYTQFYEAEKAESYPPSAFSAKLVPLLPPAHAELLSSTLDIVSSLAAHAEENGISGSKLVKLLGLWLLTTRRVEGADNWKQFYARWEWAGRVLEHLFLAKIRDEALNMRMPKRLTELVSQYPYDKSTDGMLARPRFSTRKYDALFIRIESEVPREASTKLKQDPLRIITDALQADFALKSNYVDVWTAIKTKAQSGEQASGDDGTNPFLSTVFTDETVRMLSLGPVEQKETSEPASPSASLLVPPTPVIRVNEPTMRARSSSAVAETNGSGNGHVKTVSGSTSKAHQVYGSTTDWMQFSTSGFGESSNGASLALTLMDKDVEVTNPREPRNLPRRKSSQRRKSSPPERGRTAPTNGNGQMPSTPSKPPKATIVDLVQLDEAFVDFWSDALTDPISSDWPGFVLCQLKSAQEFTVEGGKTVNWLVIEEALVHPPPPPDEVTAAPTRASSPRPSTRSAGGRKSSTFSIGKKRFTLFGSRDAMPGIPATKEKGSKGAKVGEMGEVLPEEDEKVAEKDDVVTEHEKSESAARDVSAAPSTIGADSGALAGVVWAAEDTVAEEPVSPPIVEVQEPVTQVTEPPAPAEEVPALRGEVADITVAPTSGSALATPLENDAQEFMIKNENADKVSTSPAVLVPVDASGKALPPAPEGVVASGATPGPQVALATSESAAAATRAEDAGVRPDFVQVTASEQIASPKAEEAKEEESTPEAVEPVPVEEAVAVDQAPAEEEAAPVEKAAPVEETPAVEEVEESVPAEEASLAEEVPVKESLVVEEVPVGEAVAVEETPVEDAGTVQIEPSADHPAPDPTPVVLADVEEPAIGAEPALADLVEPVAQDPPAVEAVVPDVVEVSEASEPNPEVHEGDGAKPDKDEEQMTEEDDTPIDDVPAVRAA